MKVRNVLLLLLFVLSSKFAIAQKNELVNSGEILNKSAELADSGQYKAAMTLLHKINRSDTNYVAALFKKAFICRLDSQYNDGVKYCKEALSIKANHEIEHDIYNIYGTLLLDQEKYQEAIQLFDTAIKKFPAHSVLYFNKGIAYLRQDQYGLAEQWFQKTLMINPYMYSAHYHLGLTTVLQGKIVPAYISYMSYLLFSPEGKYAPTTIKTLQEISANTQEVLDLKNNRKVFPNANYQAVEDVMSSKIALDKSYKLLTAVDDPISRQIQAVIEKLEYDENDNDFWIQYYLPLLKKTLADKKFDLLINHMFSNVDLPAIKNYVERNKKQIDAYTADASSYFDLIQATGELMWKRRDTVSKRFFYEDGELAGRGTLSKNGKSLTGLWEGYYAGGDLKSKGQYNDAGQRTGNWTWFNRLGGIKAKEAYVNGKLEGKQEYYFVNGNKSSLENYVNGQLEGQTIIYYYGGGIKKVVNYKSDKLHGEEKGYYTSGDLAIVKSYVSGDINGSEKEYFRNGKLKSIAQYTSGKLEGNYKQYNDKGILTTEGNFQKDLAEGEWKYYYDDGKIMRISQKVGGTENGAQKEYYATGELSSSYNAVKDKVDGELLEYFRNGKILSKRSYANGSLVQAAYFDMAGNTVSTLTKQGETSKLISYGSNGLKRSSITYNKAGLKNGIDTVFYASGSANQVLDYKDDLLDGKLISYYKNGKIKSEAVMAKDLTNGYYTSYYMNGNPESEGWIVDDLKQGPWSYYGENGKLSSTEYYVDNELDGYKEEYLANGKKATEYKYYRGWLEEVSNYDAEEKVISTDAFHNGQGKFKLLYPDGKLMSETTYKNGEFDGVFKSYYFDGSPERVFYYKSGLLDSTYVYYHHGGLKSIEGKYLEGEKSGLWKFYDEDGKLTHASNFDHDKMNGEHTTFFPNGNKELVAFTKDDQFQGYAKTYNPNGALAYQILYDEDLALSYTYNDSNGKLKDQVLINNAGSTMKAFFANGKPSRECTYVGGERHGNDRIYYENGNLNAEQKLEYNVGEGIAKTYYENGKLKTEFNYLHDNEHGSCKTYHENGSIKREANYEYGSINGPLKIYNEVGKLIQTKYYEHGVLKSVKND